MANVTLTITGVREFVSEKVASPDQTDVDLEDFKQEVELYLRDLLEAVRTDLQTICDNCCPP